VPAAPPALSAPRETKVPVLVAGGATVALGAGALILGLVAHSKYESFRADNDRPLPGSYAERKSLHDSGQALAVTSTVMTFAALIGGGVTAFLLLRGVGKKSPVLRSSPWVGSASAGVSLGGVL
jgi:hypothetical protein